MDMTLILSVFFKTEQITSARPKICRKISLWFVSKNFKG